MDAELTVPVSHTERLAFDMGQKGHRGVSGLPSCCGVVTKRTYLAGAVSFSAIAW
jgi:hypothetical protein